ncbi:unnamed protein product [Rotaria socialis]|uniref:Cadherin domain-containing protein n=1 Tax=Rotaria socialis TaxID=392032 RepID=A0A818Z239_9BILA|nr:unnamed protein product [Rotaria socialis]
MFRILFFLTTFYFVFTLPKESIHIVEDLPIGTSIFTFSTDGCNTVRAAGTYRFVDSQKNSNDFFLIDPYTGRVTTKKLIDRDDFCLRRMCSCSKCEITLEVLCVNMGKIFFNDLSIVVDDRNDHSPQFSKSSITIDVLENVPIGYLIPIDIAIDLDYGNNSIQGYNLFEDNSTNKIINAFQIEYSKKNDLLALRLNRTLDRELYHSLEYIIQAFDGGQPQALIGRLNIYINILDVNDMSPVFDRSEINVLISESTPIGSFIGRVHAFDGDTGLNGLVYYTIVSSDPPANGTFILSKETGAIHLGRSLDYEKEKSYRMKIKAQDNGPQQVSIPAFAMIHIDIQDENDNYPMISPSFNDDRISGVEHVLNSSVIKVRENLSNGTFLGHISISDLDHGNNGRVSWSIESNGSISIKKLFNNEAFLIFTACKFDREKQSKYDVHLTAHDHGIVPLSSTFNFTLIIMDENDNPPKFDEEIYSIDIIETIPLNSILIHFHATDPDEENTFNSQIEYRLYNQTIFSLNSMTGELRLTGKLDREEKSSYEFDIIAFDHGQPQPLSSTVHCIIRLIDINDNYPIFDLSTYLFEIPETWSNLSPIGHVHATDADEYYGELTYELVQNETIMNTEWPFELTSNGTLYVKRASAGIDYEHRSIYQFSILAIDNNRLNTSVPVIVRILNRNDFCPELVNNSTALFFNTDLWFNNSYGKNNHYYLELFDGDNDTCSIELLNFSDMFKIEFIKRNLYLLYANALPEREYYILQFRIQDLINETFDRSCVRFTQLVLTIGTNETNETVAIDSAQEYLETMRLMSRRTYSHFNLTVFNIIFAVLFLSIAIIIGVILIKLIYLSSHSCHQRKGRKHRKNTHTLYRLQGPTETQLPLLDNGSGEQSLTSSLTIPGNRKSTMNRNLHYSTDNDEQQQRLLCQLNSKPISIMKKSNEFKTFTLKSTNNPYDIISDMPYSGISPSSSTSYPHMRDSGYETTSSNLDRQRFLSPASPSDVSLSTDDQLINVTYFSSSIPIQHDLSLSSSNTISRTLKTFAHVPTANITGNESFSSSTMMSARLAEQEVIEV